jgi:predicted O-methyltransferase YrrM
MRQISIKWQFLALSLLSFIGFSYVANNPSGLVAQLIISVAASLVFTAVILALLLQLANRRIIKGQQQRLDKVVAQQKAIRSDLVGLEENLSGDLKKRNTSAINTLRKEIRSATSQVDALIQLSTIAPVREPMPISRSWAGSPDMILKLVELIRVHKPKLVVELGSGLSTLWIARTLRENGVGRLISLDHDPEFAQVTIANVKRHDLSDIVEVRVAPLINEVVNGSESVPWYDLAAIVDIENIDLALVDGPPGATHKFARLPALWMLESKMSEHAVVLIDDVIREAERDLAIQWQEAGGYALVNYPAEKGGIYLVR